MDEEARSMDIALHERNNKAGLNEMYIYKNKDNLLELDENLLNLDIVNYKITKHLYQSRITLQDEYQRYGFHVMEEKRVIYTDVLVANPKARIPFKDLFEEYASIVKERQGCFYFGNSDDRKVLIEQEKPLIKEAFDKLGVQRVRELKYGATNIRREILKRQADISTDAKIVKCLNEQGVIAGNTGTAKSIKDILQEVYTSLEIRDSRGKIKNAKATDLEEWFEIKKATPKINGKTTDCYTIIREKLIYLD
jgi:hypothetical protein